MSVGFQIFAGNSNLPFAEKIAEHIGIPLGKLETKRFSDGEMWVKFHENIRGAEVYLIQSTNPPAENLMELLILVDAARRASAKRITAVIPYFGYARQDRKDQPRVAITAKLVANLLTVAGVDRIITMDLHAPQIQGFFDIPFDHLYGSSVFIKKIKELKLNENLVVVSPDLGSIKLARSYATRLHANLVVSDKRRPAQNVAEVAHIIGDVQGKNVLIVDDLVDTGGTLKATIDAVKELGALNIFASITHPVLSGPAIERLEASPITRLFVLDTLTLNPAAAACEKISVVSAADLFAEAIRRIYNNESIKSLFDNVKS